MKQLIKIFKFAILFASSVYIVVFFITNKEDLKLIVNIGVIPLSGLCMLSVLYQLLHGFRFKIILSKCGNTNIHTGKWFRIFFQTRFLNMIVPQLGNIYRGIAVKKNFNVSYTDYISSFASFAWMDTCFNLTIATVAIAIFEPTLVIVGMNVALLAFIITAVVILLPYLTYSISNKVQIKYHRTLWIQGKLKQVLDTTITNLTDARYLLKIVTIGIIATVRTIAFYYILFRCFDASPGVAVLIIFYALFKLSSFIVITPGNIGIQEIAFGFLGSQLGVGMSEGILVCAVGRVISTSVIILLGVMFGGIGLLKHRKEYSKSDLKQ